MKAEWDAGRSSPPKLLIIRNVYYWIILLIYKPNYIVKHKQTNVINYYYVATLQGEEDTINCGYTWNGRGRHCETQLQLMLYDYTTYLRTIIWLIRQKPAKWKREEQFFVNLSKTNTQMHDNEMTCPCVL